MRNSRLTQFGGVLSIAASFCLTQWAHAVVVFHEDFKARPYFPELETGTNMIGKSPNVVDGPGTNVFLLSPTTAPNANTKTDSYDLDNTDPDKQTHVNYGLKFQSPVTNGPAQTMFWPVHFDDFGSPDNGKYNWNTDKVKITVVARQIQKWSNFAFGFADTDYNLSNYVRLAYSPVTTDGNPDNDHRVKVLLKHNSYSPENGFQNLAEFQKNWNSPNGLYTNEFATLSLEYDPLKVQQEGVSPYTFRYDGTDNGIDDSFEIPLGGNGPGNRLPHNLDPMSNNGGGGPPLGFSGVAFGFYGSADPLHTNPDFSVLIKELKLETFAQVAPEGDGDFNGDGVVDALDYVVLRAGNGPEAEYTEWAENYGNDYNGSGTGTNAAVPEPASVGLLILGLVAAGSVRRSARR